jgi:metallophosphoesterase (TIGR03767 family)
MQVTRRTLLRGTVLGSAALALGRTGPSLAGTAKAPVVAPGHTTLDRTLVRGRPGRAGYVALRSGPAEPHVLRTDLATPSARRLQTRRGVVAFAHLSDTHVVDAQSPARAEFVARLGIGGGHRPQEMLSTHVVDAMAQAVRQVGSGPVTGRPLAFALSTGDNVDNRQLNEVRWFVDLLDGGRTVVPDSGDRGRFEGVSDQDLLSYDVHYWHPDGQPAGREVDRPRRVFGFPELPGLLDACRRPFRTTGLGLPWFSVYGNHDGALQGTLQRSPSLTELGEGRVKPIGLGPSPQDLPDLTPGVLLGGPARLVTPDAGRRFLTKREWMAEHLRTTGTPVGHGFTQRNLDEDVAYYVHDVAPRVRLVVLDSTTPGGYDAGSLDGAQRDWLEAQLRAVSSRYLRTDGTWVAQPGVRDRVVVLASHHTLGTMDNPVLAPDETAPRVQGDEVRALLLRFPNVVVWCNGHTHTNTVVPHRGTAGGFWEVTAASHIDWPQQARLLELVDNRDGTLSVFGTVLDTAAALTGGLGGPLALAGLSRELSANDPTARAAADPDARRGLAGGAQRRAGGAGAVRALRRGGRTGCVLSVEVESIRLLRFDEGAPVRAASAVAPLGDGWLVAQDDAAHAAWVRPDAVRPVRVVPSIEGHDVFSSASGTKHLKPDMEAACPVEAGGIPGVLLLGSGSTPARMRGALVTLAADPQVVVADLSALYGRVAALLQRDPADLNMEGACRTGDVLRWFARGNLAAGVASASVDVELVPLMAAVLGEAEPAGVPVSRPRTYDLGSRRGGGSDGHRRGRADRRPGAAERSGRGHAERLRRRPGGRRRAGRARR